MSAIAFAKEKKTFLLPGPSGALEVATTWPQKVQQEVVGIVCHPHPLYHGTMHNKVVTTVARAFDQMGVPTVRFNYRGVGKSEGTYGDMVGEQADLRAILAWVHATLPGWKIWLAGFSFGAFISAVVANEAAPSRLISIAPAVHHADFNQLTHIHCPWLVVQGDADEVVPFQAVQAFADQPPSPLTFQVFPGVGHFFHGHLIELREALVAWLA